jgi:serine/threonine protein kinase
LGLADFELMKMLGKGAHGKVLLCSRKDQPESRFAMKILKKRHIIDAKQLEHTIAEKSILSRMNHPFLVSMKHTFQTDTKLYFVMEFLQGGELFQHLKRVSCFTENQTKFICACLVLALGHLHNANYIYRDLKPENILFDEQGFAKLSDFGLAKEVGIGDVANTFCGTPEYLAPEVILNKGCNRPADWWSLGILTFEMLFGAPPFYSTDVQEMYKKTILKSLRFPAQSNVSKLAMDFVSGLLVKNPKDRLGSIADSLEVMNHPWFSDICWSSLLAKQVQPPYRPMRSRWEKNFDPEFIKQEARDSLASTQSGIPEEVRRRFEEMTETDTDSQKAPSEAKRTYSGSNLGKIFREQMCDPLIDVKKIRNHRNQSLCHIVIPQEPLLAGRSSADTSAFSGTPCDSEEDSQSTGFRDLSQSGDAVSQKAIAIQDTLASKGMFKIDEEKACEESSPVKIFETASEATEEACGCGEGSGTGSPQPELAN